ncbi:glutamate mutase L [Phycicoccus sonneratiae]|uniref:Glutamate mutase L n=1 Tax=Phycicoccus sonneratiae TaxID=2807628 RepID=A0ABS2CQ17_9MICO|nr:glutamate mutase L [Phycicoccus sonneraticus]MBM6401918.1 glutamate mutase L [Phycicoccus sonneraticus]
MGAVLCVDVGSTFTKALLVGDDGAVLGKASHPTTVGTDVMDGVDAVRDELRATAPASAPDAPQATLLCSSAGGGLRLAVVGYEREVTAEAGFRVGLSAGARVVHVTSGPMTGPDVRALRAARPDLVLLVGGTDGGNADVLRHNARRLARARLTPPVVVAGNADAADEVAAELAATARRHVVTANVLPRIGEVAPEAARAAIREVFLTHVIGGKGLSRGRGFTELVRAATPDAVLRGVEVLAETRGEDVLVVDVGGATTDVYSVITPQGEDATIHREVVGTVWHARTVEADLGMRWNAEGVLEAAHRERLALPPTLPAHAARVVADAGFVATSPGDWAAEEALAGAAVTVALRRHGRPAPGERPRPLADVGLVVGSGGVLRHAAPDAAARVLAPALTDHAGGWRVPDRATAVVDRDYVLFAVGLLADTDPARARALAASLGAGETG